MLMWFVCNRKHISLFCVLDDKLMAFDGTSGKLKVEWKYAGRIFLLYFLNPLSVMNGLNFLWYTQVTPLL